MDTSRTWRLTLPHAPAILALAREKGTRDTRGTFQGTASEVTLRGRCRFRRRRQHRKAGLAVKCSLGATFGTQVPAD